MNTKSKLYKVTIAFMAVVILFAIFNPFSERIRVNADTVPDVEVTGGTLMSTRTETNSHTRRYNVGDEAGIYGMCASANLASPSGHTGSATTISSSTYSGTINVGGTSYSKWSVLQTAVWYMRNSGSTKNLVWEYLHKYVSLIISGQDYTPDCIYNEQQACLNTLKGLINAHGDAGYSIYLWRSTDGSNCQTLLISGKPTVNTPPETPPETPPVEEYRTTAAIAGTRKYVSVDGTEYPGKGATFTVYDDAACTNSIGTMTENEMSDHEVYYSTFVTGFGMAEVSPNVDKSEHTVTLFFKETSPATKAYMNGSWQDVTCKQDSTVYFIEYTWIYGAEGGPSLRYESGKVVNNRLSVLRNGKLTSDGSKWDVMSPNSNEVLGAIPSSWKDWLVSEQGVGFFGYTTNSKSIINVESLDCYGSLELTKLDQNGLASRGATFTIYSNEACTTPVGTFTDASNNGVYVSPKLTIGTGFTASTPTVARNYYFKETTAATQHLVNGNWINADFARDTSTYCLYLVYYPSSNALHYSIQNLTTGAMLVTDKVITSYDISGIDSQRCKYNFTNIVSVASMAGNKIVVNTTDFTNNNLSGFAFELLSGNTVVATGITDSNGNVIWTSSIYTISSDRRVITNLPFGTYTYRETTPVDHYYSYNGTSTTIPYTYTMTNPWALGPTGFYERVITLTTANTLEAALTTNLYTTQNVIGRASLDVTKVCLTSDDTMTRTFDFNIYYLGNAATPSARGSNVLPVSITVPSGSTSSTKTINDVPVGWYEIEEVSSNGYETIWQSETRVWVSDGGSYEFACTNYKPTIHTTFLDAASGTHQSQVGTEVQLIDTVYYENLVIGETYTVTGTVMDKDDGTPFTDANGNEITATKTFVAETNNGTIDIEFTVDTSLLRTGTELVAFETLTYNGNDLCIHADLEDLDQTVYVPKLGTTLTDVATGTHTASYGVDIELEDVVTYSGLIPGYTYTIKGELYDVATGESIGVTGETEFVADARSGQQSVTFTVNTQTLSGKTIVAFEDLCSGVVIVASHKDLSDLGQTVYVPKLGTTLTDDKTGTHSAILGSGITLNDVVSYDNLEVGKTYTIKGELYDVSTGNPIGVTAETEFTAESTSGNVTVEFKIDTTIFRGFTVVAFEEVYDGSTLIAAHADLSDTFQTVYIPDIQTTATDKNTGSHYMRATESVTILDTVEYVNLNPGTEYEITGTLVDATTGDYIKDENGAEIKVTKKFTPDTANGTVEVEFTVNGLNLVGRTLVVFEEVYFGESLVAIHSDISDEGQTVYFPNMGTTATVGNEKTFIPDDEVTLTDEVTYENLEVGATYVIEGTIMVTDGEKSEVLTVDGKPVTATVTFVPEKSSGKVTVEFKFDASELYNKTAKSLVVFESLYAYNASGNILILNHNDITDKEQTVGIKEEKTTTQTGETRSMCQIGGIACIIGCICCVGLLILTKKNEKNENN